MYACKAGELSTHRGKVLGIRDRLVCCVLTVLADRSLIPASCVLLACISDDASKRVLHAGPGGHAPTKGASMRVQAAGE